MALRNIVETHLCGLCVIIILIAGWRVRCYYDCTYLECISTGLAHDLMKDTYPLCVCSTPCSLVPMLLSVRFSDGTTVCSLVPLPNYLDGRMYDAKQCRPAICSSGASIVPLE